MNDAANVARRLHLLSLAADDLAFVSFHTGEMQEWFVDFVAELRALLPIMAKATAQPCLPTEDDE